VLQIPGGESDANDQANLGLFGLGKRRTLDQLSEFVNVDLKNKQGNSGAGIKCSGHEWVPYDATISPQENLFTNPDNLDPQPEYPLRTKLQYYQQVEQTVPRYDIVSEGGAASGGERKLPSSHFHGSDHFGPDHTATGMPSAITLFVFWVFGLVVWCIMFVGPYSPKSRSRTIARKKSPNSPNVYKDV